jgi:hypothetical protein
MAKSDFIKLPRISDKDGDLPQTEDGWVNYVDELHSLALSRKREYERQWVINAAMYLGHQNLVFNRTSGIIDFDRDDRVPITVNRIGSFIEARLAKLTKNLPIARVIPNTNDNEDVSAAKYSDKSLMYLWDKIKMQTELSKAIVYKLLYGNSFIKTVWDPAIGDFFLEPKQQTTENEKILFLDPEGGLEKEKIFMGEVSTKAVSPFSILVPNENCVSLIEQPWIMERIYLPIIDIEGMWPHLRGKIIPEMESQTKSEFERLLSSLTSTLIPNSSHSVLNKEDSLNQEGLIKLFWMKPNWQYTKGVVVAIVNKELAMISEFPNDYGDTIYPYVKLQERNDGSHFWQQATIERLIPIQKAINRLKEQKLTNAALMANIKWMVPKGSGLHDLALDDSSGEIVEYNSSVPVPAPAPIAPMPNYVQEFDTELKADFRDAGSQFETSVSPPPRLVAGVAMEAFAEMSEEGLIPTIKMLSESIQSVAHTQLMLMNQEYFEKRKIKIIGTQGRVAVEYMSNLDLRNHTDVHIEVESLVPQFRSQKTQRLFDLWDRRIINDPNEFLELLRYGNWDMLLDKRERIKDEVETSIRQMVKGREPEVHQFQNHIIYLTRLSEFVQTPEFLQLIPERKQLILNALQTHASFLMGPAEPQQNQAAVGTPFGPETPPGSEGGGAAI